MSEKTKKQDLEEVSGGFSRMYNNGDVDINSLPMTKFREERIKEKEKEREKLRSSKIVSNSPFLKK